MPLHRYVAIRQVRRRSEFDISGERLMPDSIQVIVEDETPIPTGIFDASGTQLYRVADRRPCGFTAKHDD